MKNILITGISGYLGSRLVSELADREDVNEIIGIDVAPPRHQNDRVTFYQKDIRDPEVGVLFSRHEIDTVFHLAFVVQPIRSIKNMHDIDVNGTRNILEGAHSSGVDHFIAVSSTLAYGAHPDNPRRLSEDAALRGNKAFPYGFFKAETDRMITGFAADHPEMPVTVLRPCTVFGPSIDNYISRMLFLPVTVCVKGHDPLVQFVHEDDFVRACITAMEKRVPGVFNITGDGSLTVSRIAEILGTRVVPLPPWLIYPSLECLWRLHFPKIEVNRGYLDYIRHPFIASNKKAKKILGFYPKHPSLETLKQTMRSRRGDPARKKGKAK